MASIFRKSGYTAPTGGAFYRINQETGSSLYGQQLAEEEKRRQEEERKNRQQQMQEISQSQAKMYKQEPRANVTTQVQPTGIFQQAKNIAGSVAGNIGEGVSGFLKESKQDIAEGLKTSLESIKEGSIFTKKGREKYLEATAQGFESKPVEKFMGGYSTVGSQATRGIQTSIETAKLDNFMNQDATQAQEDYRIMKDPNATDEEKSQAKARRLQSMQIANKLQEDIDKNAPKEMTTAQMLGAGLETGIDLGTLGGVKYLAKAAKSGLKSGLKIAGKEVLEDVVTGGVGAMAGAVREGETKVKEIAKQGIGGALIAGGLNIFGKAIGAGAKVLKSSAKKGKIVDEILTNTKKVTDIPEGSEKQIKKELKEIMDDDFAKMSVEERKQAVYDVLDNNDVKVKQEVKTQSEAKIEAPTTKETSSISKEGKVEKGETPKSKTVSEVEIGGEKKPIEKLTKEDVAKGIDEIKAKNKEVDANIKAEAEQAKMESVNIDVIDELEGDLGRGLTKTEIKMVDEAQKIGDPASYDEMLTSFRTEKPPELQVKTDNNKQLNALKRQEKIITGEEVKTRGLAKGIEAKAIENKLTESFGDLPEYSVMNRKKQIKMATEAMDNNFDEAIDMALGKKEPPKGVTPESMLIAVEERATKENNIELLKKLAVESSLIEESTTMGQRISMLAERNPNSASTNIQKIAKKRNDAFKKRTGTTVKSAKKAEVKKIKKEIKKTSPTKDEWENFINEITC